MPYFPLGSLRSLMTSHESIDVQGVARELGSALDHIHSLSLPGGQDRLVHRDLKPENVLVRSLEPLDLVLCDFGLVRAMPGSIMQSAAAASDAYRAPESASGAFSVQGDWWALGIILAELAAGRHPLTSSDGTLSVASVNIQLVTGPIELSHIEDSRVRLLCSGLLTRDRRERWAWPQVSDWLSGGSPAVTDETAPVVMADRNVTFREQTCHTPTELADALQCSWNEALERLFQDRDEQLRRDTIGLLEAYGVQEGVEILQVVDVRPIRQLTRLLALMNPQLQPSFGQEGIPLSPDALVGVAAIAGGAVGPNGSPPGDLVRKRLAEVRENHVLSLWRRLPGMQRASEVEQQWIAALNSGTECLQQVPESLHRDVTTEHLDWATLQWVLNPMLPTAAARHHAMHMHAATAQRCRWWATIAARGQHELGALLVARLFYDAAVEEAQLVDRTEATRVAEKKREQETREATARLVAQASSIPRYKVALYCVALVSATVCLGLINPDGLGTRVVESLSEFGAFRSWYDAWPIAAPGGVTAAAVGGQTTVTYPIGFVSGATAIAALTTALFFRQARRKDMEVSTRALNWARVVAIIGGIATLAYAPVLVTSVVCAAVIAGALAVAIAIAAFILMIICDS